MTPTEFAAERRRKKLLERWIWTLAVIRNGANDAGRIMGERIADKRMVPWDRA